MPETTAIAQERPTLNINPCIFVGIGTTGLRILEKLRRLFYEEFGVAGLPCFRYVVLETNKAEKPEDNFLSHPPADYERIDLIPMTIPDLDAVRRSPELLAWLDERTLKFSRRGYEEGAGHRRQAGRLCLWENWPSVRDAITQAVQQVVTPHSRTEADRFLRESYFARKPSGTLVPRDNLVQPVPRVYLTGTLCGGTCSGVFLEVAFFFRSLLQVRNRSNLRDTGSAEIIGLFTIPDTIYLKNEKSLPHVASCWAALSELDFYTKDDTVYDLRFPNQPSFSTREPPFTTTYLASNRHTGQAGFTDADAESLPQMCAMNLFTEVVAGMAAHKAANRVNLPAAGQGFFEVNPAGYIRAFSSFGLSAIWYPRDRITKAICRQLGEEMANDWLGNQNFQPPKVEETVQTDGKGLLDWANGSLLGTVQGAQCSVHLPNEIAQLFDRRWTEFNAASRDGLENCLLNFPGGDTTIGQRLSPGGEYYRHVATAMPLLVPDLRARLRDLVVKHLRQRTFAETQHYLKTLEAWAKTQEEKISPELPSYSQQQNLSGAAGAYEDRATWALGLRRAAIEEYKKEAWNRFRERTLQYLERLRDHFLKQALANAQGELASLRLQLGAAETKLTSLRSTCIREREELVKCPHSSNIVILSQGVPDSIADDVAQGAAAILQSTSLEKLRGVFLCLEDPNNPQTPREYDPLGMFERRQDALIALIEKGYEGQAQEQAARFQIGHDALRTATAHMQNLVHFSSPYFEPSPQWQPMVTPQKPNFLFCSDQESARELADQANQYLLGTTYECKPSTLDHFVFFYQETPGLALSDLAIAHFAAQRLEVEETKADNAEPTRYTHKLGRRMFDPQAIMDMARQWVRDSRELAPELFQTLDGQPFLAYRAADGTNRDVYVNDDASIREFIRENGPDSFIRLLAERLAGLGRDELVRRMNLRRDAATSRETRAALTTRHQEILRTVSPSNS